MAKRNKALNLRNKDAKRWSEILLTVESGDSNLITETFSN